MGNWTIQVKGLGIHHNKRPDDANEMAKVFVEALRSAGHQILGATFTVGSPDEDISAPLPPATKAE